MFIFIFYFFILIRDKQLRVFDFKKGKLRRKYDESVQVYQVRVKKKGKIQMKKIFEEKETFRMEIEKNIQTRR